MALSNFFLAVIIVLVTGCSSVENPKNNSPIEPTPRPTASPSDPSDENPSDSGQGDSGESDPPLPPTVGISAPTGLTVQSVTDRSFSLSWNENYSIIDPEMFVQIELCGSEACLEEDYFDYAYSFEDNSSIIGLFPATNFKVRIRSEKGESFSEWVYSENIRTLEEPVHLVYKNSLDEFKLYSSHSGFDLPRDHNLIGGQEVEPTYFDEYIVLPIYDTISGVGKILLYNLYTYESILATGSYSFSQSTPSIKFMKLDDFVHSTVSFLVEEETGELSLYYLTQGSGNEFTTQKLTEVGNISQVEKSGSRLYILSNNSSEDIIYSLDAYGNLSEVIRGSASSIIKDLNITENFAVSLEYNLSGSDPIIHYIDLLSNTVSSIEAEHVDVSFGLKSENKNLIAKSSIDGTIFVLDDYGIEYSFLSETVSDISFFENSVIAVKTTLGEHSLEKQDISFNSSTGEYTAIGYEISGVIKDKSTQLNPYIVREDKIYFISKSISGKGVLARVNVSDLSGYEAISNETIDDISSAGLYFVNDKIFVITKENRLLSFKNGARTLEIDLSDRVISAGTNFMNQEFFVVSEFICIVGLSIEYSASGDKDESLYVIDRIGNVSPLVSADSFSPGEFFSPVKLIDRQN